MAENEFSELINAPHGKEQNIKMQLIDMIQQAANPFDIIMEIARYLESQSAERGYAQQVKENLRTIYGTALGDKKLLADELKDASERCERIRHTQSQDGFSDEEKARMEFAIKAHERIIARIQEQLDNEAAN